MNTKNTGNLNSDDIYDHLSKESKKIPITKWDFGASCSEDVSAQVDRGSPKQLKSAQRSSITIRVWNQDGLVGITSTSDLTSYGLEKSLNLAYEASKYGNRKEIPQFSSLAKEIIDSEPKPYKTPRGISTLLSVLKSRRKAIK